VHATRTSPRRRADRILLGSDAYAVEKRVERRLVDLDVCRVGRRRRRQGECPGVESPPRRVMTLACALALFAFGLIVWSLLDPRPIPVIVAMSVGQVIGTLSFAAFLVVVAGDLRSRYKAVPVDPPES
jgi:Flp pilus assembly protein TadB